MARLIMISKDLEGGAAVSKMVHPRTGQGVGRFRVKQIIAWNMNGINNTFKFSAIAPNYGAFELYDSSVTPAAEDLIMRIPVSSKSRINLTIPQSGVTFEKGIWMKVGAESNDNDDKKIYLQLVGYELR
jgi:hypothetical protein